LAASLTPQQISILRRVGAGLGLPAYVLRPRNCAQDVELLIFFRLMASKQGELSITLDGAEYLDKLDSDAPEEQFASLLVAHGRDHSIGVELWPQEY